MKSSFSLRLLAATFVSCLGLATLRAADHSHAHGKAPDAPKSAIAVLVAGPDGKVSGTIRFTQQDDGVKVEADVKGLTPGKHGFHVHEHGDLSKPDFTSAGGHFNPKGHPHADRSADQRHVGDLGNLEADAQGNAKTSFVDQQLQLTGPDSIIGRAVIVHAKADDLKSQPTGDAGGRVAGGVIGVGK